MKFDETELIEYFGAPPIEQNLEEKEFFGSSEFEISRDKFILRLSFSSTHSPKVIADVLYSDMTTPVLHVAIQEATEVKLNKNTGCLQVFVGSSKANADFEKRLDISLDPLKLSVFD